MHDDTKVILEPDGRIFIETNDEDTIEDFNRFPNEFKLRKEDAGLFFNSNLYEFIGEDEDELDAIFDMIDYFDDDEDDFYDDDEEDDEE